MKKQFLLPAFIFLTLNINAQQIENGDFDSVYIGGIDRIHQWITSDAWGSSNFDTVIPFNPSAHYTAIGLMYHEAYGTVQIEYSGAFHGPYAIKVLSDSNMFQTDGSPFRGFITNGNHFYTGSDGYIDFKKGGTPFTGRPVKLKGHFKFIDYSPSLTIFAKAIVLLKKYNPSTQQSDTIGFAESSTQLFPDTAWSPFELNINYFSSGIPDTLMIAFLSPGLGYPSTLWLDSLGFDYTSTGVNDLQNQSDVSVFPNPVKDILHIQLETKPFNAGNKIRLLNLMGEDLFTSTIFNSSSTIDMHNLPSGIYFIRVTTSNRVAVKKIILQH